MFIRILTFASAVFSLAGATSAEIVINDAYARSSGPAAMAGAAFMEIVNTGAEDDRLVAVRSDAAKKVELHTHIAGDGGVMKMREVEGGFPVPAGGHALLARGGDHVMFMGLAGPFEQGGTVPVILVFEKAGEIAVEIPVDLERQERAMDHSKMKHSN
ncbi:hypothetical protein GCM10011360_05350 [Primorskyibacter flagellatus]|uniref:Copper chaperone PCu(A)C n=1 Tax=Primorskyibacter flagellatus TaxID=1387277 RepID=A0A916ZYV8_9RHOB|nr:copper chaperone PCu(A)C [Primorskyibacter flagellatus]GGE19530.1 hypothetical protein GCM10011360_05350 [Primorskyibacter flagellatus]